MSSPQTKVSVYRDGTLIHEQVLGEGEYVVDPTGAVRLTSTEVPAGTQTKLGIDGSQWTVTNSGGLEQTLVDGETIAVPPIIMPGERLRVGDKEIVLSCLLTEEIRPGITVRPPGVDELASPDRYSTGKMIARGGMGVIMTAHDRILERDVAMKLMLDGSKPEAVARFYQEAQITAQLEHPNIVPVHELRIDGNGKPFYTMKLVRGVSLKRILERLANGDRRTVEQWPLSALLTVFQKICDAIAFAHARGVIHRDLKPDNIMLGHYGEAQAMDWGLAKILGQVSAPEALTELPAGEPTATTSMSKSSIEPTMSGTVIGTPQYMSPEQASGAIEMLDERTDIYSLGAILYHILALRPPFNGQNSGEVMRGVRQGRIVPLEEAGGEKPLPHTAGGRVPDSLAAVCRKAMALAKSERYASVKILQGEIEAYRTGFATSAEAAGIWKLASLFFRRHRTVSIAAAAVLLAGVIFAINLAHERDRARVASVEAQAARRTADQQRDVAEDQLYFSEMLQAGRHLADGRPESARELLRRHQRETSGRDLRGWEWHYLMGEANQDRLRVHAHAGGVFAVAVSADGSRIATGGGDGDIAVWKARGLVPEFRLHGSGGAILTVAWHSGGKLLAAGRGDGIVQIWDIEKREKVAEYQLDSGNSVRSVGWRPNDGGTPTLAIGSLDRDILLWRLPPDARPEPEVFAATAHGIAALHWSADGRQLAVGKLSANDTVEVFDYESRKKLVAANTTAGNDAFTVALDPTGKLIAAGSKHLVVVVYELPKVDPPLPEKPKPPADRKFLEALHRGFVSALAWSPNGRQLASASHDGTIRISTIGGVKEPGQILSGHQGEVNALTWSRLPAADGRSSETTVLFSGGADGTLRAWSPNPSGEFALKDRNWIAGAKWNGDGSRLAVVNFRDAVYLSDPASGLSVPLDSVWGNLFDVAWSPAGDRLATCSRVRNTVECMDARTGRNVGIFALPKAYRVAWSASGRYLAACGAEEARVWDTQSGKLVGLIPKGAGSILWRGDEKSVVLGCDNGAIELWEPFLGKQLSIWRPAPSGRSNSVASETEPPRRVFDLQWSPDGHSLAFVTQDSVAGLLDSSDGHLVRTFEGHASGIWRVVWSADGRRLATVGQGGTMRIYDSVAGRQVAQINHGLGNSEVHGLDWSRDGRRLSTGGFDLHVRLWDALRGEQIEAAERMATVSAPAPDLETLRNLGQKYTSLGWAGQAREVFQQARILAPGDPDLQKLSAEAEARFDRALDIGTFDDDPAFARRRDAFNLLNKIHDAWDRGQGADALAAWQDLARIAEASDMLPLARAYFSRARWQVTWFSSQTDPVADLAGWRALAGSESSVTADVRSLSFPYLRRSPKELLVHPEVNSRGPAEKDFGMVARTRLSMPAGMWRFRTSGGGGVRVTISGQPVIENWSDAAPFELAGTFRQMQAGVVEVLVENFVRQGIDDFQFQIEPVAE